MKRVLSTIAILLTGSLLAFAQPPQGQGGFPPQGMGPGAPQGQAPQGGFRFQTPEKPSDPSFETKDITITSRGKKLFGVAVIPKGGPAKKPTVIMSHGYGGNCQGFYGQMAELGKAGYVCYAIDFQGGGRVSQSEGDSKEMSIFTERENLIDVIDAVRTWSFVDPENIFLVGESQGGCVSALTAPRVQDKIKAIALVYPALCIPDDAKALYKSPADIPEEINFMGLNIGKAYYENVIDFDIYSAISGFKKDVLIVHGDKDGLVNISYSRKALPLYDNVEFHVIPEGGHGFFGELKTMSNNYIADFLKREIAK